MQLVPGLTPSLIPGSFEGGQYNANGQATTPSRPITSATSGAISSNLVDINEGPPTANGRITRVGVDAFDTGDSRSHQADPIAARR
jgi:hypothetical protein